MRRGATSWIAFAIGSLPLLAWAICWCGATHSGPADYCAAHPGDANCGGGGGVFIPNFGSGQQDEERRRREREAQQQAERERARLEEERRKADEERARQEAIRREEERIERERREALRREEEARREAEQRARSAEARSKMKSVGASGTGWKPQNGAGTPGWAAQSGGTLKPFPSPSPGGVELDGEAERSHRKQSDGWDSTGKIPGKRGSLTPPEAGITNQRPAVPPPTKPLVEMNAEELMQLEDQFLVHIDQNVKGPVKQEVSPHVDALKEQRRKREAAERALAEAERKVEQARDQAALEELRRQIRAESKRASDALAAEKKKMFEIIDVLDRGGRAAAPPAPR